MDQGQGQGAMARKAWSITSDMEMHYKSRDGAKTQKGGLRLRGEVILAKADPRSPITLWFNLDGTAVWPGDMIYDDVSRKGYYQDLLEVEAGVCRKDASGKWVAAPDMKLVSDGPQTYNGTGAVSSSVSFNFSASGNVGFFGDTPTGGVGVGMGTNETYSFSRSLQDFVVDNDSTGDHLKHRYRMTQSTGCAYGGPNDLTRGIRQSLSFSQSFYGAHVFDPPDLALHDYPIISQGVWQAKDANMIGQDACLIIQIKQHVWEVEGTNNGRIHSSPHGVVGTWLYDSAIPFSALKAQAGTTI